MQHSGDRFKPKKASTGGDTHSGGGGGGGGKVEPYAYWQFDRKMLNRYRYQGMQGLQNIIVGLHLLISWESTASWDIQWARAALELISHIRFGVITSAPSMLLESP